MTDSTTYGMNNSSIGTLREEEEGGTCKEMCEAAQHGFDLIEENMR